MFAKTVTTYLFFDVFPLLFFPLLGVFIYFTTGLHKSEYRFRALLFLAAIFGGIVLFYLVVFFPNYYDYVQYFLYKDNYVQVAYCQLESAYGRHSQQLYCTDGRGFISKYRYPAWRWIRDKQTVQIFYLPRSRMVLKIVPQNY